MRGFDSVQTEQQEVVRFLVNSYQKNRLLHAYIFEGAQGTKKLETAKLVAKMLLCESDEPICHSCRACTLIENQMHANVSIVQKEGQTIKKEQITALQHEFSKTAIENKAKIYIIDEADKMSVSAANSLLKFLEEPSANTYAILLTSNKQNLLPTIRSRAVTVTFKSLSKTLLAKKYEEAGVKIPYLAAALTQNLDEGIELVSSDEFNNLLSVTVETLENLSRNGLDPSIIVSRNSTQLKEKEHQLLYLRLLMIFFEDVLQTHLTQEIKYFKQQEDLVRNCTKIFSSNQCLTIMTSLLEAQKKLMKNINFLLCIDELFYQMKGGY